MSEKEEKPTPRWKHIVDTRIHFFKKNLPKGDLEDISDTNPSPIQKKSHKE